MHMQQGDWRMYHEVHDKCCPHPSYTHSILRHLKNLCQVHSTILMLHHVQVRSKSLVILPLHELTATTLRRMDHINLMSFFTSCLCHKYFQFILGMQSNDCHFSIRVLDNLFLLFNNICLLPKVYSMSGVPSFQYHKFIPNLKEAKGP